MTNLCVIYDLDGTLVDSEGLCNQAFLDLLPELADTVELLVHRYRGMKLAQILADIEHCLDRKLPKNFESRYRERVAELFERELKPMPGVYAMLASTDYPRCVASSGPRAKIRQALEISGLATFFNGNIFSSYEVGSWKPEPGLFLHAAETMGFFPKHCVVVEDSIVGIEAAAAARMRALLYVPKGGYSVYSAAITFNDMSDLPRLLEQFAADMASDAQQMHAPDALSRAGDT